MNKSGLYLANSLLLYPTLFNVLNQHLRWSGFYIGHRALDEKYNNHLFITGNIKEEDIVYVEGSKGYVNHYPWKNEWVFIFECPVKDLVKKFLQGRYSEMYTDEQIKTLFFEDELPEVIEVLRKSKKRRKQMMYELNCYIEEDAELDSLPQIEQEIYEYQRQDQISEIISRSDTAV